MAKPIKPTTALVSKSDVQRAKVELDRMRGALKKWLKYRTLNDEVVAGTAPTTKPRKLAAEIIMQSRDLGTEQQLAKQLYVLLCETMPGQSLPNPDVSVNPQAAVQLATLAINGGGPPGSPQAQGAIAWWWPAIIVGGLLMTITTIIKTQADVAKDREEKACIAAGACTDSGFWLKAGGIVALAYVAWNLGLGERVKRMLKGGA